MVMKNKYDIISTSAFRKDIKRLRRQGADMSKLDAVVEKLARGQKLEEQYRDHPLKNNRKGFRDCHIEPDWVLIYKIDNGLLVLTLTRTGSHSELGL